MTLDQLIAACDEPNGLGGEQPPAHITLVLTKRTAPRDRTHLAGRAGPLGKVCIVREHPLGQGGFEVVAIFKRAHVKAFALKLKREQNA